MGRREPGPRFRLHSRTRSVRGESGLQASFSTGGHRHSVESFPVRYQVEDPQRTRPIGSHFSAVAALFIVVFGTLALVQHALLISLISTCICFHARTRSNGIAFS